MLPACSLKHGAAEPVPSAAAEGGRVVLTDFNYLDEGDRTRVIIESNLPYDFTTYNAREDLFVLEMSEVDTDAMPEEIAVESRAVDTVRVVRIPEEAGRTLSRMEFHLSQPQFVDVLMDGDQLYLDFSAADGSLPAAADTEVLIIDEAHYADRSDNDLEFGDVAGLEAVAEKTPLVTETVTTPLPAPVEVASLDRPVATVPDPLPEPAPGKSAARQDETLGPAGVVNLIEAAVEGNSVTVAVAGDGRLACEPFELPTPHRLVLDFSGTVNRVSNPVLELESDHLYRVRVAQFQQMPVPITRVVIDLKAGPAEYRIVERGRKVLVLFGDDIDVDQSAQETAAAVPPLALASVLPPLPREPLPEAIPAESVEEPLKETTPTEPPVEAATPIDEPALPPAAADEGSYWIEKMGAAPQTAVAEAAFPFDDELDGGDVVFIAGDVEGDMQELFESKTITGEEERYTGEKISFEFTDADLQAVFFLLADISGENIVLDPSVRGKVSIKLTDVPWDQALDIILRNFNLGRVRENNVIRIAPTSKLSQEEKETRKLREEKLLSVPLVTKTRALSYAKASEVSPIILKSMSARDEVTVDQRTNMLIMKMVPESVDLVDRLIDLLDRPTPQVMIEARIVETTKSFSRAFGIQWGFLGMADATTGTTTNWNFPNSIQANGAAVSSTAKSGIVGPLGGYAVNLPASSFSSGFGLSLGNILDTFRLDMALTAMEADGRGKILSSPKVATQNNKKAVIESGTQIPVQTTANNTTTTQFVTAALKLEVTPQITADQTIIMDVVVDKSAPDFGNLVGGIPPILTRKAQAQVMVKDGGTAVIGGIFQWTEADNEDRVPFFGSVPIIRHLFRNKAVTRKNDELLLFLTPRIIKVTAY
jgi:type IV pilus assembly protein PilQ